MAWIAEVGTHRGGGTFAGVRSFFEILSAARECAGAVERGRVPAAAALERLGIDRRAFDGTSLR